jgi:MoaA/NifB/PqqE/SkfB family radical SAM enzyme
MKPNQLLKSAYSLGKYHLFKRKTPLSVIFSITHECNYKCKYCQVPIQGKKDLNTEQVLDLIKQMKEAGTQRLGIQGGEPLLRNDIGKIINYAKELDMFVTMGTNGSLLKDKIKDIKNVDAIVTSYDGPNAHNNYREKGSYESMLKSIKLAVDNGIKVWNVTVLSKDSIENIDLILKQSKDIGFHVYFTPMMNLDTTGDTASIIPSKENYKKAIEKLTILKKEKNNKILNSISYLKYIKTWPDFKKTIISDERYKCYASKLYCHVAPDGKVYPCINLIHKTKGHDVVKLGFKNAFQKSSRLNCKCSTFSFVELNLLFSLNISSVYNSINQIK